MAIWSNDQKGRMCPMVEHQNGRTVIWSKKVLNQNVLQFCLTVKNKWPLMGILGALELFRRHLHIYQLFETGLEPVLFSEVN